MTPIWLLFDFFGGTPSTATPGRVRVSARAVGGAAATSLRVGTAQTTDASRTTTINATRVGAATVADNPTTTIEVTAS